MATLTVASSASMAPLILVLLFARWVLAATPLAGPLPSMPTWMVTSAMQLQISAPDAQIEPLTYYVAPLTLAQGANGSDVTKASISVRGTVVMTDMNNYQSVNGSDKIAYVACDPVDSPFITIDMMMNSLMSSQLRAILLYSVENTCCDIQRQNLNYTAFFTVATTAEALQIRNVTESGTGTVLATISGNASAPAATDTVGQSTTNSAIAMSILYSITGLITLMFLVIIATGAIRAHRYPERYGPRAGLGGRPRQSRAKGLARAVLDTLPIVKFGGPEQQPKPDPALELENGPSPVDLPDSWSDPVATPAISPATDGPHVIKSEATQRTDVKSKKENLNPTPIGAVTGQAAASSGPAPEGDNLGCSICTEDFTVGEDVRVLPCDHKFHPPCIDPWLVNVAGTCPLCRLDLRPHDSPTDSADEAGAVAAAAAAAEAQDLAPPLEADTNEAEAGPSTTLAQRRRSARTLDLNRLRHASVEERIEGLRRYRTQQQQAETSNAGHTEDTEEQRSRRARLTARLKDTFRVRTGVQTAFQIGPA